MIFSSRRTLLSVPAPFAVISLLSLSCTLASNVPLYAQEAAGGISGTVSDPSQAVIPGAAVAVRNTRTNLTLNATSNSTGFYDFPNLPPGEYIVTITQLGFQTLTSKPFSILSGQNARLDLGLRITGDTNAVDVSTSASQLLNTTSNDLGTTIEPAKIAALPLNQRNFFGLVALQPGVNASGNTGQNNRGGFEVNGSPGLNNNILIDGVDATFGEDNGAGPGSGSYINTIGLGAIEELRTTSSVPPPEYGRASGGILSITTKSGTNQFHGSVFEYFRNDILDANTWNNNHVTPRVQKPKLRFNEFGANLGGPVYRDRAFFFFNYEGDRVVAGNSTTGNTPTPALIASVSNPQVATELSFMPAVTAATTNPLIGLSTGNRITSTQEDTYVARGDVNLGAHRLLARLNLNNQQQAQQQFRPSDSLVYPLRFYNADVGDVWTIRPNVLNEFRFGFNRNDLARQNSTYTSDPTKSYISVTGAFSTDTNQSLLHFLTTTYGLVDNMTVVRGKHTYAFGTDNRRLRSARVQDTNNTSYYSSIANLQKDIPYQVQITFKTPKHFDQWQLGFYAQDNYRATQRLTLNYGLRYDKYSPLSGAFNVIVDDPFSALSTDKNRAYMKQSRFDFAPRLGLVYDVTGKQKLIARAGFGLMFLPPQPFFYYDSAFLDPRLPFNAIITPSDAPGVSFGYPFSKTFVDSVAANPNLLPATIKLGRQIANPDHPDQYSENWNANLQYAVTRELTVQATYTALRDIHEVTTTLPNQFAAHTCNPTCGARPNNSIGNINYDIYEGRTTYDALFLQASYRHGISSADIYYTFGSNIQEWASNQSNGNGQTDVQDLLNPQGSRGWSSGQTRNRLVADFTVAPPVPGFAKGNVISRAALSGYRLQSILQFNTGTVTNVLANIDLVRNNRTAGTRPDRVPGVSLYATTPQKDANGNPFYLNTTAFNSAVPFAAQRFGNLGYNAIYGPHQVNVDLSLIRGFHFFREQSLDLRAELFDALNHANLSNPVTSMTDANFGKIITRSGPRNVQFGATYRF